MKKKIKYALFRLGVYSALDFTRSVPTISRWIKTGCAGVMPTPIKRRVILSYLKQFKLDQFIETGTHYGDTLAYIASDATIKCMSIELAEFYYLEAQKRFAQYKNVKLLQGDSAILLKEYVAQLKTPSLFWLDGHYSGCHTAKGYKETPIEEELSIILNSPLSHVILIDDARCFTGQNDYPRLETLIENIRNTSQYAIEISGDIIRCTRST